MCRLVGHGLLARVLKRFEFRFGVPMKIVWTLFAVSLFFVTGCEEKSIVTFEKELSHPAGLRVGLPTGFVERELPKGFILSEAGDLRSPREIMLEFASSPAPGVVLDQVKQLDSGVGEVRFGVSELGVGSAGTEYELVVVLNRGSGALTMKAFGQSELGIPDFATAWAVLETVRLP